MRHVRRLSWRQPALALAGAAAALLTVELGLRLIYSDGDFRARYAPADGPVTQTTHPFLPYTGKPGLRYTMAPEVAGELQPVGVVHNAYGYRAHEFPADRSPEDLVVVALGGSTTRGYVAASNAETWPGLLEGMLSERHPERTVRVFNLGADGGTTATSVVSFALVGTHLEPDLVVVYHGFNDYGPMTAVDFRTDHAHHFRDARPEHAPRGVRRRLPVWLLRSRAVAFSATMVDRLTGIGDLQAIAEISASGRVDDVGAAIEQRLLPNLRTIHSIAERQGAHVLFSTFQFFDGQTPDYRALNDVLRSYFERSGLDWVDQDALVADGDPALMVDECHFTRAGRELVARNFFEAIVSRGWFEEGG